MFKKILPRTSKQCISAWLIPKHLPVTGDDVTLCGSEKKWTKFET